MLSEAEKNSTPTKKSWALPEIVLISQADVSSKHYINAHENTLVPKPGFPAISQTPKGQSVNAAQHNSFVS